MNSHLLFILALIATVSSQAVASEVDYSLCQDYFRKSTSALSMLRMDDSGNISLVRGAEECEVELAPTTPYGPKHFCLKALGYTYYTIYKGEQNILIDIRSSHEPVSDSKKIQSTIKYSLEIVKNSCVVKDLRMAQKNYKDLYPEDLVFSAPLCAELECAKKTTKSAKKMISKFQNVFLKDEYLGNSSLNRSEITNASVTPEDLADSFDPFAQDNIEAVRFNVYGGNLSIERRALLVRTFCKKPAQRGGFDIEESVKKYYSATCSAKK